MIQSTVSFLLLILSAIALRAQSADVLLSPPEPSDSTFPASAAMQSAARVGARSLVVWGNTAPAADSTTVRNILVMQAVDGTAPLGAPVVMTDPAARPENVVAVLPLSDRFLVLWNDYRASPAKLYCQVVDTAGTRIGGETLLDCGVLADGVITDGLLTDGNRLWTSPRGSGYALTWLSEHTLFNVNLDRNGMVTGTIAKTANWVGMSMTRLPEMPGVRFFGNAAVYEDGSVKSARVPFDLSYTPHYLLPDTSVVLLRYISDTLRRLMVYRSLFDTVVTKTVDIPVLAGTFNNLGGVARDSAGRWNVFYARRERYGDYLVAVQVVARKLILDAQWNLLADTTAGIVTEAQDAYTPSHDARTTYGETALSLACDDITIFSAILYHTDLLKPQQIQMFDTARGSLYIDRFGNVYKSGPQSILSSCQDFSSVWASRDRNTRKSAVILHDGNREIARLAAPIAFKRQNLPQRRPVLFIRGGNLFLSWQNGKQSDSFMLANVRFRNPIPSEITDTKIHPSIIDRSRFISGNAYLNWRGTDNFPALEAMTNDHVKTGYSVPEYVDNKSFAFYAPIAGKWQSILYRFETFLQGSYGVFGYDPGAEYSVASMYFQGYFGPARLARMTSGSNSDGTATWVDTANVINADAIIPIADRDYLLTDGSAVHRVRTGTLLYDALLPDSIRSTYQRLLGNYFLRVGATAGLDSSGVPRDSLLRLEIYGVYDSLLRPRSTTSIRIPTAVSNMFIAQRRSDFALAIGWGSEGGLHLILLDKSLSVKIADTIVSATRGLVVHPSGIFQGDSLYLAWEDYRNGAADIYGNAAMLPLFPAPPDTVHLPGDSTVGPGPIIDTSAVHIVRVYPSPARHGLTIEFSLPPVGAITIDLFDELGRTVRSYANVVVSSDRRATIDLRGIHPGAYFMRVSDGRGTIGNEKIFVVN